MGKKSKLRLKIKIKQFINNTANKNNKQTENK